MGTSKASKKSRATKGCVRSNKPKATSNQASHTKQSARSSAASSAKSPKRQVKTKRAPRKSNKPKATSNQASHMKRNAQSSAASSAKSPKRQVKTKRPTMGTSKASKKSCATKGRVRSNKPKATSNQASHRKRRARSSAASSAKSPKQQVETKVEFSGHATSQLMNLGLTGTQREEVEEWHKEVVRRELIQQGAHHALIMYLAHSEGSKDPKPHITALLRNEDGSTIKNAHGKFVHVYYDVERLPPIYADARR